MKMRLKAGLAMIFLFLGLLFASPVGAESPTVSGIAKELLCQCGCTMVLSNCECEYQEVMIAGIEQQIAQGRSKGQIIDSFVAQYGEQVLLSPTKKGFNLMAWILPFVALLAGGIAIYIALRAWVRRGKHLLGVEAEAEETDEEYRRRLEKELEEFTEEEGFR